jgi:hypothetical protein
MAYIRSDEKRAHVGPWQVGSATDAEPIGRGWRCAPVSRKTYARRMTGGDLDRFKRPGRSCSTGPAQHPGKP